MTEYDVLINKKHKFEEELDTCEYWINRNMDNKSVNQYRFEAALNKELIKCIDKEIEKLEVKIKKRDENNLSKSDAPKIMPYNDEFIVSDLMCTKCGKNGNR